MEQIAERNLESSQEISNVAKLRENRMAFDPEGRKPEFVFVKCGCNDKPLDWDQSDDEGENQQILNPSSAYYMQQVYANMNRVSKGSKFPEIRN